MSPWFRIVRKKVRIKTCVKNSKSKIALAVHKESAKTFALSRLLYWNQYYNFKYGAIKIKSQTTRWGSCSSKGNLNFNYRIVLLPEHLADYLIVHELCHLGEFNHSQKFWNLVKKTIPDFAQRRYELKKIKLD